MQIASPPPIVPSLGRGGEEAGTEAAASEAWKLSCTARLVGSRTAAGKRVTLLASENLFRALAEPPSSFLGDALGEVSGAARSQQEHRADLIDIVRY